MGIVEKDLTITDRYGVANSSLRVYLFPKITQNLGCVWSREGSID
jgi:hypothetical protein